MLKPLDTLNIDYPLGNFTLDKGGDRIAFLSGGIGITPIRSMCKYAVDKKLGIDMILVYANHTAKDIVFKEDFELMSKEYQKLKVIHLLSEPEPGLDYLTGRIDAGIIKSKIADYASRKFYICGPPAMVEAMKKMLRHELALPEEKIITEQFQGY